MTGMLPARRLDVELRLSLFGVKRLIDLSRLARYRNTLGWCLGAVLVIPLTLWLLAPAAVPVWAWRHKQVWALVRRPETAT